MKTYKTTNRPFASKKSCGVYPKSKDHSLLEIKGAQTYEMSSTKYTMKGTTYKKSEFQNKTIRVIDNIYEFFKPNRMQIVSCGTTVNKFRNRRTANQTLYESSLKNFTEVNQSQEEHDERKQTRYRHFKTIYGTPNKSKSPIISRTFCNNSERSKTLNMRKTMLLKKIERVEESTKKENIKSPRKLMSLHQKISLSRKKPPRRLKGTNHQRILDLTIHNSSKKQNFLSESESMEQDKEMNSVTSTSKKKPPMLSFLPIISENTSPRAEFKINEIAIKFGRDSSLNNIYSNFEDYIFLLSQPYATVAYMTCFSSILSIYKLFFNNFFDFIQKYSFKGIIKNDPYSHLQVSDSMYRAIGGSKANKLGQWNISLEGKTAEVVEKRVEMMQYEHYFFVRKYAMVIFRTLEQFIGVKVLDYGEVVQNLRSLVEFVGVYYRDLDGTLLSAFGRFFLNMRSQLFQIDVDELQKIAYLYISVLNRVLYQNIDFYRGHSNRLINLENNSLRLGEIFMCLFQNSMKNKKIFSMASDEFNISLISLFQALKELCVNQSMFMNSDMTTKECILDFFSGYFTILKSNSLLFYFCELSTVLNIKTSQFFQSLYLEFLEAMHTFKAYQSPYMLRRGKDIFISIRKHFEKSWDLKDSEKLSFDTYLLRETALFAQRFIKQSLSHNTIEIAEMMISLIDCIVHFLTVILFKEGLRMAINEYGFLETHFKGFASLVNGAKWPRKSEFDRVKEVLMNKMYLVIQLFCIEKDEEQIQY